MIQKQQSPPPNPLLRKDPLFPPHPQQESRRISQIREFPFPPSHPQFVAAKSLIL